MPTYPVHTCADLYPNNPYTSISSAINHRLQLLEDDKKHMNLYIVELKHDIKLMNLTIEQYKKSIEKVEQLLIAHGLKQLLTPNEDC